MYHANIVFSSLDIEGLGDNPSSENDESHDQLRPGPLSGEQQRQCADMIERLIEWIQLKAADWKVSESTVARALGLHDIERRKRNLWNKFQARFYSVERGPEGMLSISYIYLKLM